MTPDEPRLECLKLVQQAANANGILLTAGEIVSRARAFADFVMDRSTHGGAVKANGVPNLELALEDKFRIPVPPTSQFERGALARAVPAQQVGPPNSGKLSSQRPR